MYLLVPHSHSSLVLPALTHGAPSRRYTCCATREYLPMLRSCFWLEVVLLALTCASCFSILYTPLIMRYEAYICTFVSTYVVAILLVGRKGRQSHQSGTSPRLHVLASSRRCQAQEHFNITSIALCICLPTIQMSTRRSVRRYAFGQQRSDARV